MNNLTDWFSLLNGGTTLTATVVWIAKSVAEMRRSRRVNGETTRKKF